MSKLKSRIDYKQLEVELQEALKADDLYKLRNDAKLRAVEQNVPTYEHFRQMVNGAHLRPLNRDDVKPKVGVQWNPTFQHDTGSLETESNSEKLNDDCSGIVHNMPRTYEEFIKTWRKINDSRTKFGYLISIRNVLQKKVFSVEVPPACLSDILTVCNENLANASNVKDIVEILKIVSTCRRFHLTSSFMTPTEKAMRAQLFRDLLIKGNLQDERLQGTIKSLSAIYGVECNRID